MGIHLVQEEFIDYLKKIENYNEAINVMYWDLRTGAPKNGAEQRSNVISQLSSDVFEMTTSTKMENYLVLLEKEIGNGTLTEIVEKSVKECREVYDLNCKIPKKEYAEYVKLCSLSENAWEEAKDAGDFSKFQPFLEKIVETKKRFIEYWGYTDKKYDTLLNFYEPGMTTKKLDEVFGNVRERLVPLVAKISNSAINLQREELFKPISKEIQKNVSEDVLRKLGYNFDSGRLDETVHPFQITLNPGDVRVTTKYIENNFMSALFGTIHECGHASYEQNISASLIGTPLCQGASMGIHESQSLFFENMIGRSLEFWSTQYEELKSKTGDFFTDLTVEEFYRAINHSEPSLIRIEADECTYPLHIMVRYEIEKELFDGDLQVKDLPTVWNEKMEKYLGVIPSNNSEGVLQDVHWSGGDFGYFPSYALGAMYAAQFKHAMKKELPKYNELLKSGELHQIVNWLTKNIHQYGKLRKPNELLVDITGEELNVKYFIDYLEEKYSKLYKLG
ncbi:carboxypeptidase M32 [Bacillus sp. EAC]|uniref:carboxypeptidase M32 n=1 Tax=Bacillus sp. EAC TaxID=1978338 RepID=UPI000B431336|nr:carboxypeptidase M32 [Bacillus sp. EAC]